MKYVSGIARTWLAIILVMAGIAGCGGRSSDDSDATTQPNGGAIASNEFSPTTDQDQSSISFQEALQIAEGAVDAKAYAIELEKEEGEPIVEIEISDKEVIIDAETGEILQIDNLLESGDPEDTEEVETALELQKNNIIPIQEALEKAENLVGGTAHTVALENKQGNLIYEVFIGLNETIIDAGNGEVLHSEEIIKVDDDIDVTFESSIQVP